MRPLRRTDLLSLEAYAVARAEFRARTIAHKRIRRLALGAHASLLFEDRLTVQYQVQEMLRIERIFEPERVQDELDAYNPLIPDGRDLRATLSLEYADAEERRAALVRLGGIEDRIYAEIDGHRRASAHADDDLMRSTEGKTSAVHFLRFAFAPTQIAALRAGAALSFGCDDPRMPLRVEVSADLRASLLCDFD